MQAITENPLDMKGIKPQRRYDLDWIRVLATFGVIIFHTMRMFNPDDWEVKTWKRMKNIFVLKKG